MIRTSFRPGVDILGASSGMIRSTLTRRRTVRSSIKFTASMRRLTHRSAVYIALRSDIPQLTHSLRSDQSIPERGSLWTCGTVTSRSVKLDEQPTLWRAAPIGVLGVLGVLGASRQMTASGHAAASRTPSVEMHTAPGSPASIRVDCSVETKQLDKNCLKVLIDGKFRNGKRIRADCLRLPCLSRSGVERIFVEVEWLRAIGDHAASSIRCWNDLS